MATLLLRFLFGNKVFMDILHIGNLFSFLCLKSEIACSFGDFFQIFNNDAAYTLIGYVWKFVFYDLIADVTGVVAGIVDEILLQRHQCVGVTTVGDLPTFAQRHKAVARASLAVAGGAETRYVSPFHQPADNLV